jgi:hypothetical protein
MSLSVKTGVGGFSPCPCGFVGGLGLSVLVRCR